MINEDYLVAGCIATIRLLLRGSLVRPVILLSSKCKFTDNEKATLIIKT